METQSVPYINYCTDIKEAVERKRNLHPKWVIPAHLKIALEKSIVNPVKK